jgi:hypothetical protein
MNESVKRREHLHKEANRVLSLKGFKTLKEQTTEAEKAVVSRVRQVLIFWKHKVCYSKNIGDDKIKSEFDVKHIWSQYLVCKTALQTASADELASGTVQTPEKGGSLVWTLEKKKGKWIATLNSTRDKLQAKLKRFNASKCKVVSAAKAEPEPTPKEAHEAREEDQVAQGGSKIGRFAALPTDAPCGHSKPTKEPKKGYKKAAKTGHELNPKGPAPKKPVPKKTKEQKKREAKEAKIAAAKLAHMKRTPCRHKLCRREDCAFMHGKESNTREKRNAHKLAHEKEEAAEEAAREAAEVEVVLELELESEDDEDDEEVAGPAEEQTAVTGDQLEEMRAKMQAEMEAAMKAQMDLERAKMREAIREQMMAEEEEKQKKNREHQEKVKAGGFSKSFEMKFTTPALAPFTGLSAPKGAPGRFGLPPRRVVAKKLDVDESSKKA